LALRAAAAEWRKCRRGDAGVLAARAIMDMLNVFPFFKTVSRRQPGRACEFPLAPLAFDIPSFPPTSRAWGVELARRVDWHEIIRAIEGALYARDVAKGTLARASACQGQRAGASKGNRGEA